MDLRLDLPNVESLLKIKFCKNAFLDELKTNFLIVD